LWQDFIVFAGAGGTGASAWKISPAGGEKVRQLTGKEVALNGCQNSLAIHRGVAYLCCGTEFEGNPVGRVRVVDVASGRELAVSEKTWGHALASSPVAIGDRLLPMMGGLRFFSLGTDYKALGTLKEIPWADVPTPALVDGLMFFRGKNALYCHDLRRQ
jgi:hypothetical protein